MNRVKNFSTTHLFKLDRCLGSCNTLNDLSYKACGVLDFDFSVRLVRL